MDEKGVPIKKLNLSENTIEYLENSNIKTLEDLFHLSMADMFEMKGIEVYSAAEILYTVGEYISHNFKGKADCKQVLEEDHSVSSNFVETPAAVLDFKEKKVLHIVDEGTLKKEFAEVLFFEDDGMLVDDVEVINMNLSARSVGILVRNELDTAKKILFSNYKDYEEMQGFGKNSQEEVLQKLKQIMYVQYESDENRELIEKAVSAVDTDIKEHCPALDTPKYKSIVKAVIYKNKSLIKNSNSKIIEDKELMNGIYSDLSLYRIIEDYLCSLLRSGEFVSLNALKKQMPEGICNSNILLQMIDRLSSDGKVDCTDRGLRLHSLTLEEYVKTLKEDNSKKALLLRLQGMTLEEAGGEIGVTRERARQLTKKVLEKSPKLMEDEFAYWYENYNITAEEFQAIFDISKEGYQYVTLKYSKGSKKLEELLTDENITGKIAQRVLAEMRKYCVVINGEYIPIRRDVLVRKLLEVNFSDKECTISEFSEFYRSFLNENNLEKDEKLLFPTERAFEARIADNKYALLKYGHRIRYYDMEAYDIQVLFNELEFYVYKDLEISTLKLFRLHRELMKEYDIRDEYELHNLMKKNEEKLKSYDVNLGRMPLLSIGMADRERQTIQFLYRVAPIGLYEFGNAYEEEFGIKSETVLANFGQYIDKYYHNGYYAIDYEIMSAEEYRMLESRLKEDIYCVEDVKSLYLEIFPYGRVEKINPYTLKTMGFKVFSDYILRNSYASGEAYFRELLQKDEIVDMDMIDKRLTQNQTFQMVLDELRVNFELLEIEKNKYMSFSAFSKKVPGVKKEDLEKFAIEASNFNQADFFTVQSIRKEGFCSNIDDLGLSDWFFGALLRSCKDICYSKVAGGFLFSHLGRQFKRSDFFMFLMKKLIKINITEFIDFIKDTYGLCFERYDITPIINQSDLYYSSKTEKIYLNKEIFYEELQ